MRARSDQTGQATVDYAAVVLVVSLVLLAMAGVAAARGALVTDAITRQIARALCIVTGGDCDREREPCVVARQFLRRSWRIRRGHALSPPP